MMPIALLITQLVICIALAPFLGGLTAVIKNRIRMRRGQSVFQPYYNLAKFASKGEVVSEKTSWIFRAAPFVALSSSLAAAVLVPVCVFAGPLRYMGDLVALIYILALGRFFLALAALDAGSAFGGMGSSREMFISALAEPALALAVFSLALQYGSTAVPASAGMHAVTVSSLAAGLTLFLVTLAETSRVPVDNQETHLELTMVHEAMVLEYSGRSLALIEMASYVKQLALFFLIAQVVMPIGAPAFGTAAQAVLWGLWYAARLAIICIAVAVVEVSVAKMRLFRVADFLGFAFVLGIVAVVCSILGV